MSENRNIKKNQFEEIITQAYNEKTLFNIKHSYEQGICVEGTNCQVKIENIGFAKKLIIKSDNLDVSFSMGTIANIQDLSMDGKLSFEVGFFGFGVMDISAI